MLRSLGLAAILALAACGAQAQPKTPEQTFIETFNSMSVDHQVSSTSDKAALTQAGHAACTAAESGATSAQVENDLSAVGITDANLAHMIRLGSTGTRLALPRVR